MTHIAEADVPDLVTRLVEKSLVVYEEDDRGNGRYRLLRTVRQYARDGLMERGEAEGWRERHVEHFLALTTEAELHLTGAKQQRCAWQPRTHEDAAGQLPRGRRVHEGEPGDNAVVR